MPASFITFNIIPDLDTIHTFDNDTGLTLPNESFTITGTVEVTLARPIQIRQLYVQFQGNIDCVISTSDFYFNSMQPLDNPYGDEIPIDKWNTIDSSEIGFIDKLTRKALGQANANFTIADQRVNILNQSQVLPIGKSSWPFSLTIQNTHTLPSSVFLPHHLIQYHLFAKIKLNSLSERVKFTYWNARMNTLGLNNVNCTDNPRQSGDSLSPLPSLSPSTSNSQVVSPPPTWVYSDSVSKLPKSNRRQLLGTNKMIQFYRHSYPSLYSLYSVPRIRYRGSRKDRIQYEIGMSKFTCLQNKKFDFVCKFEPVANDCKIESLEFYLEQNESYPIRAGDYNSLYQILPDTMVPRYRKFSRKHYMQNYESGTELKLTLLLNLPQIAPTMKTPILQICHKLRLILKFENEQERNMSLSFPLSVGTVPGIQSVGSSNHDHTNAMMQEDRHSNIEGLHVRQELDQWLLTPDHHHYTGYFDKLPSYMDAIEEGNPPSPFIEDNI
ncbi:hypothetical protein INT48_006224 [Thamnidium elegans]|uniref:Arrestin-like N-terminal domain-containing protein n=1 Tax=Thamnidium elegans TaxID=101142 RepID=A0A8H7SR51_9FUNG|nr:hypothetical protein INT48_006224 [Thamnidium elegans]